MYTKARTLRVVAALDQNQSIHEITTLMGDQRLPLACPVEPLHAFLLAWAQALKDGDAEASELWKSKALSVECQFEVLPGAARRYRAMKLREDVADEYEAIRMTPLLRALSFAAFKEGYEKHSGPASASTLCEKYKEWFGLNKRSGDEIKPGWVDAATTFVNRCWSLPKA